MLRPFSKYFRLSFNHISHKNGLVRAVVSGPSHISLRFYASSDKKDIENIVGSKQPLSKKPLSNLMKDPLPETRKVEAEIEKPQTTKSDSSGGNKKKPNVALYLSPIIAAALLYQVWNSFFKGEGKETLSQIDLKRKRRKEWIGQKHPPTSTDIPSQVPYLLIGGGTASFAAFRAIKSNDPTAQILVISNEPYYPYMRPPLSKEMFYDEDRESVRSLKFRQWNGKQRSLFYEHDDFYADIDTLMSAKNGGIAVARGWAVTRVDASARKAYLEDGKEISFRKCLIATGAVWERNKESPTSEGRKKKTRKVESVEENEEGGDDGEEENEEDPLRRLEKALRKMAGWWKQPTIVKMVTKPQTEKFERYMVEAKEALMLAREDKVRLETRVEERGALVEMVRNTVREEFKAREEVGQSRRPVSYAEATGRKDIPKISGVRGPVMPVPKLVVIRQENKDSEDVKKKLKELVKPSEIGLKVKRLNKIRNGVIVEIETEDGVEKLLKNKELQKAGMKVGKPTKKSPTIMVYDVNSALKDEEVKEEVFGRNLQESGISEEEFKKEFEIKHRYKERTAGKNEGRRNHLVVECSVRVRNWLRRKGKIYIEWESCRIKDYVDVARCFKCQRYGHVAKFCTSQKPSCSHCAGEHEFKDCQKKTKEDEKCINCVREGRIENKHTCSWRGCPAYEKAVKRYSEQVDYGV